MNIKVSIIDDHPIVLQGLGNMLQACSGISLSGAYTCMEELMAGLKTAPPDILLLDIQMPGKSGAEMVPEIRAAFPFLKIVALTNVDSMSYVHNMLKLGVKGYILKTAEPKNLITAIKDVYMGSEVMDESLAEALREFTRKMKRASYLKPQLTPREKEVVQLIAKGASSQEMADKLFLSIRTIEFYRLNIMTKMDVNNAAALVHKAITMGIIL